jgi:hypothetical protein
MIVYTSNQELSPLLCPVWGPSAPPHSHGLLCSPECHRASLAHCPSITCILGRRFRVKPVKWPPLGFALGNTGNTFCPVNLSTAGLFETQPQTSVPATWGGRASLAPAVPIPLHARVLVHHGQVKHGPDDVSPVRLTMFFFFKGTHTNLGGEVVWSCGNLPSPKYSHNVCFG